MTDNLSDIVVFVRVVEKQSFTAAARDLNLSPSAVSRRITHLEEDLGVQLIKRSTRRLVLTEIAIEFYEQCARILHDLDQARGIASAQNLEVKGVLRVHATLGLGERLIAPAVREFLTLHPDLQVDLTIGPHAVNVLEERYDLVIRSAQVSDSSLAVRELGPIRYTLCATPAFLAEHGTPADPQDLKNFNCLIHTGQTRPNEWRFERSGEILTVLVAGNLRTNNGIALHEAVRGGLGIARLPDYAVREDLDDGVLMPLFGNLVGWGRAIKACFPRGPHQPLRLTVFLDFLVQFMRQRSLVT